MFKQFKHPGALSPPPQGAEGTGGQLSESRCQPEQASKYLDDRNQLVF